MGWVGNMIIVLPVLGRKEAYHSNMALLCSTIVVGVIYQATTNGRRHAALRRLQYACLQTPLPFH